MRVRWPFSACVVALGCGDAATLSPTQAANVLVAGPDCTEAMEFQGSSEFLYHELVVTESYVYARGFVRFDKWTGMREELGATGYGGFGSFGVASDGLYWIEQGIECSMSHQEKPAATGGLFRLSLDDGEVVELAGERYCPEWLALDHEWLGWWNAGLYYWPTDYGMHTGAEADFVAHGPGTPNYAMRSERDVTFDEGWLYFADGTARRINAADGTVEVFTHAWDDALSIDDAHIYGSSGPDVVRMSKSGTDFEVVARGDADADGVGQVEARAPDYVYWTSSKVAAPGMIVPAPLLRMPKEGGTVEVLHEGPVISFVIDEHCAYINLHVDGPRSKLIRVPR